AIQRLARQHVHRPGLQVRIGDRGPALVVEIALQFDPEPRLQRAPGNRALVLAANAQRAGAGLDRLLPETQRMQGIAVLAVLVQLRLGHDHAAVGGEHPLFAFLLVTARPRAEGLRAVARRFQHAAGIGDEAAQLEGDALVAADHVDEPRQRWAVAGVTHAGLRGRVRTAAVVAGQGAVAAVAKAAAEGELVAEAVVGAAAHARGFELATGRVALADRAADPEAQRLAGLVQGFQAVDRVEDLRAGEAAHHLHLG